MLSHNFDHWSVKNAMPATNERRRSPRYKDRLTFSVSLLNVETSAGSEHDPVMLVGHTGDISAEGLALIVPSRRFVIRYLASKHQSLRITLDLPTGSIAMQAIPMRFEPLGKEDTGLGFMITGRVEIDPTTLGQGQSDQGATDEACLIGVKITAMSDKDRELFMEYVNRFG